MLSASWTFPNNFWHIFNCKVQRLPKIHRVRCSCPLAVASPSGKAALQCAVGTGGRPWPWTGSQGSSAIWAKSHESSALALAVALQSSTGSPDPPRQPAGCCAALTGTWRMGVHGQVYPHIHCPSKIKFPVQTWVCVKCKKQRTKPASGRMIITAAVALLDKTLYLILESNNGERQERKWHKMQLKIRRIDLPYLIFSSDI